MMRCRCGNQAGNRESERLSNGEADKTYRNTMDGENAENTRKEGDGQPPPNREGWKWTRT